MSQTEEVMTVLILTSKSKFQVSGRGGEVAGGWGERDSYFVDLSLNLLTNSKNIVTALFQQDF